MRDKGVEEPAEHRIAAVAEGQGGVISAAQLRELGLTRAAVSRRVAKGTLHPWHRGVYAVGHRNIGALGRRMAAVLACGDGAVVSHATAADAWDLRRSGSGIVAIIVPVAGGRKRHERVRVHRVPGLAADETTMLGALPITTPERTLFDLAAVARLEDLVRAFEQAEALRIVDHAKLAAYAERRASGVGKLRAAIGRDPDHTRSWLERRFVALCAKANVPKPLVNTKVGPHAVDFLWPEHRLVVETDGRRWHDTRRAFETDRRRDADLAVAGYRVVRITYRRIRDEPDAVVAILAALLGAARAA